MSEVLPSAQSPPIASPTSSGSSSRAGVKAETGAPSGPEAAMPVSSSRSRVPPSTVEPLTTVPVTTTAATATAAPTTVCVRRRAAPARRRIEARGSRVSVTRVARWPKSSGRSAGEASLASQNAPVAASVSRSASPRVSPSSLARSAIGMEVVWSSSSALRCDIGSEPRASKVARASGSRDLSRCQIRAVWRRCACVHACGRTHDSGSGSRLTLRQWCQVTMKESRTAERAAGRSPVST